MKKPVIPKMWTDEQIQGAWRHGTLGVWSPELIRLIEEKKLAEAKVAKQAATIERLTREVRELQPRVFPMACFLCEKPMDSPDDYEWHGLGNCVPLCEVCNGQGFVSPARNQIQIFSPAQKMRSWNKSRKDKSKIDAALSQQEPE